MADLQLVVAGQQHAGWTRIRVHRGMEEIAGDFDLEVSERWSETVAPIEVRAQDKCAVVVAGETLITGCVDRIGHSFDPNDHKVSVNGRDATGDLVDCAAEHAKGEWRNADIGQIARDLASPFGIKVTVQGDIGAPFPVYAIEPGESAFECLERAARQRGVRLVSDGLGGLLVGTRPAESSGVSLVEGDNLISCSVSNDCSQRFSKYTVRGQQAGTEDTNGKAAAQVKATALDAGVLRYRPLVVIGEDQGDISGLQQRAKWERTMRAARALRATARVQGWSHSKGLWHPNTLVRLTTPTLRLDRDLLVCEVDFVVDESGTFTELTLVPEEAYSLLAMPAKKKAPRRKHHKKPDKTEDVFS